MKFLDILLLVLIGGYCAYVLFAGKKTGCGSCSGQCDRCGGCCARNKDKTDVTRKTEL